MLNQNSIQEEAAVQQKTLIEPDKNKTHIGRGISLEIRGGKNGIAIQSDIVNYPPKPHVFWTFLFNVD
ncbi:MAG: hypothetical protein D3922_12065, partial [Candidatus Electrothrix sp. AR1]|nr:hypothetical protein [Candidatus Electrothrix sp. AR1]